MFMEIIEEQLCLILYKTWLPFISLKQHFYWAQKHKRKSTNFERSSELVRQTVSGNRTLQNMF